MGIGDRNKLIHAKQQVPSTALQALKSEISYCPIDCGGLREHARWMCQRHG